MGGWLAEEADASFWDFDREPEGTEKLVGVFGSGIISIPKYFFR